MFSSCYNRSCSLPYIVLIWTRAIWPWYELLLLYDFCWFWRKLILQISGYFFNLWGNKNCFDQIVIVTLICVYFISEIDYRYLQRLLMFCLYCYCFFLQITVIFIFVYNPNNFKCISENVHILVKLRNDMDFC
jgi:hypothetical protein